MRARLPDPAPIPEAPAGMPLDAVLESTTPLVARGLAAQAADRKVDGTVHAVTGFSATQLQQLFARFGQCARRVMPAVAPARGVAVLREQHVRKTTLVTGDGQYAGNAFSGR